MPDESLPSTPGPFFEDCFETYIAGECVTWREAFVRHPILMARRVLSYEPIVTVIAVAALIGAVMGYRRWKKKKAMKMQTHDTEKD